MAAERTIRINDQAYRLIERYAAKTGQSLEEVVEQTLESSLPEFGESEVDRPLSGLADEEVLTLADLQMDEKDAVRHRALLDAQQERDLSDSERIELWQLTQQYRMDLLRKAEGIQEAVLRGLRPLL
jgi:hypothetical protein